MFNKKCRVCKKDKSISNFHKDKSSLDGLVTLCKNCASELSKKYGRTKKGLLSKIYAHQKYCSKNRGHKMPTYSKEELKRWLFSNEKFHKLYDDWVSNKYYKYLTPSVDRIDDTKGYSFDNIQIMTWGENDKKYNEGKKSGLCNKDCIPVVGTNKKTGERKSFYSMAQASRDMNITSGKISMCISGIRKSAGGYVRSLK